LQLGEARALELAQSVGAGGVVQGVVSGTEEEVSLTATLLEVPSGRVRVRRATVEGPYENRFALIEALINQLLATDYGPWTAADLPVLSEHEPAAVQAYLAGDYDAALALDSTFLLAALVKYEQNEDDIETGRFVWERRDQLSPRDRANIRALVGWYFGETQTLAERFAQYDSVGKHDWEKGDLVWQLWAWGRLAGIPGYLERAKAVLLHYRERGGGNPWSRLVLSEIAAQENDTAAMRLYADEIDTVATNAVHSVMALAADLRVALRHGDSELAVSLWQKVDAVADSALCCLEYLLILLVDGEGLDGLDRFFLSETEARPGARRNRGTGLAWARARGRYADWKAIHERLFSGRFGLSMPVMRIRDALFLGEPVDSSVLAAVSWMDSVATGWITVEEPSRDPEPETRYPALARCWSTLWKVSQGETAGARETVRYLREELRLPGRYAVCAGLIEVLVAEQEGGDLQSAVVRLDSIVRPVPMPPARWLVERDGTFWIDNLFLSRKLVEVGDTAAALAASRRPRPWNSWHPEVTGGLFVDLLREEARLTAMAGDTAGAIDAYEHYFNLRDTRPESQHWAAQWDSVRVEYGALTGVEGP
jgi:hypothetical protein